MATRTAAGTAKKVARTGKRKPKFGPTPNGSVYVKPNDMEWKPSPFAGIQIKVFYEDKARGELTCLLKWQPGASLPFHKHPEIEQSWVIEGSFRDHDGIARAGEYVWRRPGSFHETKSDEGATILAIYRKPNLFFYQGREADFRLPHVTDGARAVGRLSQPSPRRSP